MTILTEVQNITSGDRRRDYGRPLVNHLRIALMWSVYLNSVITPDQVVWMMTLLKGARDMNTPKYDNSLDTIGYQVCLDDMVNQVVEEGYASDYQAGLNFLRNLTVGEMHDLSVRYSQEPVEDSYVEEAKSSMFDGGEFIRIELETREMGEYSEPLFKKGQVISIDGELRLVCKVDIFDNDYPYYVQSLKYPTEYHWVSGENSFYTGVSYPFVGGDIVSYNGATWRVLAPTLSATRIEHLWSTAVALVRNDELKLLTTVQIGDVHNNEVVIMIDELDPLAYYQVKNQSTQLIRWLSFEAYRNLDN